MNKGLVSLVLVGVSLALSACGGGNPFKFNSDPAGEEYKSLKGYETPVGKDDFRRPTIEVSAEKRAMSDILPYEGYFAFQVVVYDPATASINNPPVLLEAEAPIEPQTVDKATPQILDASSAVECSREKNKIRSLRDGKWQFQCAFNSKNIPDALIKDLKNSGQLISAQFRLAATSPESNLTSHDVTVSIPIQFSKDAATTKDQGTKK